VQKLLTSTPRVVQWTASLTWDSMQYLFLYGVCLRASHGCGVKGALPGAIVVPSVLALAAHPRFSE
jgi:hypothetical protein